MADFKNCLGRMLPQLVNVLESYRGRDKIMRLVSYICTLIGGSVQHTRYIHLAQKLFRVGEALSNCRTILRLFDDLAMLTFTLSYGLGKQEKDCMTRCASLLENFFNQGYYPIEHLAWGIDNKLVQGKSSSLWYLGSNFWVGSLMMNVIRNLCQLAHLKQDEIAHKRKALLDSHLAPVSTGHNDSGKEKATTLRSRVTPELKEDTQSETKVTSSSHAKLLFIKRKRQELLVSTVACVCDSVCGIHWSQPGVLWAGKLSTVLVGLLGTISSSCFLYNYLLPASEEEEITSHDLGPEY